MIPDLKLDMFRPGIVEAMPWPTLQFIFLYNGALCKVVRPKCTRGLVHGLRLGQLSNFVGLKVTFSL